VLTPRRQVFDTLPDRAIIIDPQELLADGYEVRTDGRGRSHFTAFWRTDLGWVPDGVRAQVFHTNLIEWATRHMDDGCEVYVARPCSYPGCGKPTACLPVDRADPVLSMWGHLDPDHETVTHIGYPMPREASSVEA
jgi:hypothetical protein